MKRGGAMEDRRLRRTRERLRESLLELLGEKDIRAVTVKELTDRADVNRGTFYSHYQDIYDMLDQLEAEVFGEFTALLDAYTQADLERGLEPILRDVFCFVDRHAGLCLRLMAGDQENAFFQRLRQEIHRRAMEEGPSAWCRAGSPTAGRSPRRTWPPWRAPSSSTASSPAGSGEGKGGVPPPRRLGGYCLRRGLARRVVAPHKIKWFRGRAGVVAPRAVRRSQRRKKTFPGGEGLFSFPERLRPAGSPCRRSRWSW